MEKEQRTRLQKATQDARRLLEEEFRSQLLQTYDIDVNKVRWAEEPGVHLLAEQRLIREKLIAWIEHRSAQINDRKEALLLALREMAFTALNRFVALKLMEARELVRPCVSGGLESAGFLEFTAVAQGLLADQESSYRLFLETIFEDVSRELRALFDPRDPASLLWPKRAALLELLDILNRPELAELWSEDETLGWVYQYFNGDAERKKMREESAAPRNSRELAVRNQFFTPRYVVEFLTDNTLGRIWYEMRQGQTGLKDRCRYLVRRPNEIWLQQGEVPPAEVVENEGLSQEEVLQQPVHIAYRPLKDPREIRMLDPACGSMHFGLYAFDLYLEIYEEAWELAQTSDEKARLSEAFAPFVDYIASFTNKVAFLCEVPKLILLHNIHGIDIDPRATQIARLTLWLRAQRAWQQQQLEVAARPPITRSNVVCAEPMPGEKELLADFVDQQFPEAERGLIQQLLEEIFDKMQMAGEAGSLLRIEIEIRDTIDRARREWQQLAVQQQDLFSPAELEALGQAGASLDADIQSLAKDFWINIEERIYAALHDFAKQSEFGACYQRRLFAEDAAQGFSFIDVCRNRYDLILMNSPFGEPTENIAINISTHYPSHGGNMAVMFHDRATGLLSHGGRSGAVVDNSILVKSSYSAFRDRVALTNSLLREVCYLGWETLDDANVEVALVTTGKCPGPGFYLIESSGSDRAESLLRSVLGLCSGASSDSVLTFDSLQLSSIPNYCIAFSRQKHLHASQQRLGDVYASAKQGLMAVDTPRFARLRWEVPCPCSGTEWRPINFGGSYSPFYRDHSFMLDWTEDGAGLKAKALQNYPYLNGNWGWVVKNERFYGKPGLAYGKRTDMLTVQIQNRGMIFGNEGFAIFPHHENDAWFVLGLLNAPAIGALLNSFCGQHKVSGYLESIPVPVFQRDRKRHLSDIGRSGFDIVRQFMASDELSANFCASSLCGAGLGRQLVASGSGLDKFKDAVLALQEAANSIVEDSLGIAKCRTSRRLEIDLAQEDYVASQVSQWIGCIFGRWDIRYATGERTAPDLPDPFAPLPDCPPGQLQNSHGLPVCPDDLPDAYPLRIPWDGIVVDDPNHPRDIVLRLVEVIKIIWSGRKEEHAAEIIEHEACELLGVKSLRDYVRKPAGFFAYHLKRYSKSRRQAPIYWQLSAGSNSYSAWLYYHRFTQDTLYRVLRDFVEPRIQQAEREQFELESQGALSGDGAVQLQEAQALLQDLRLFKSELDLVAPLWNPNLNDGVIINHALLWRITPYTPWQKKCKECWDKLVKGDYDWAHLAFHLWPERVIPKCTTDRSLAIAHGLEERLWQETNNGNWLPRQLSEAELQALISEHTKPAVKNALERFLTAPPPVAPTRTRASRSTRSTGSSAPRRPRGTAAVVDAEATRQVLLALTAAPSDGLAKAAIADLVDVEANALTAVIKQLKESGQIDQLGERRGARYVLSEQGRAAVASESGEQD